MAATELSVTRLCLHKLHTMCDENWTAYPNYSGKCECECHNSTPEIITADGIKVSQGDRVFDYYDGHWGTIGEISSNSSGWFDHIRETDSGKGFLNGERVCYRIPRNNPFYSSHGKGNPS